MLCDVGAAAAGVLYVLLLRRSEREYAGCDHKRFGCREPFQPMLRLATHVALFEAFAQELEGASTRRAVDKQAHEPASTQIIAANARKNPSLNRPKPNGTSGKFPGFAYDHRRCDEARQVCLVALPQGSTAHAELWLRYVHDDSMMSNLRRVLGSGEIVPFSPPARQPA